jgi:hypothetical protein
MGVGRHGSWQRSPLMPSRHCEATPWRQGGAAVAWPSHERDLWVRGPGGRGAHRARAHPSCLPGSWPRGGHPRTLAQKTRPPQRLCRAWGYF